MPPPQQQRRRIPEDSGISVTNERGMGIWTVREDSYLVSGSRNVRKSFASFWGLRVRIPLNGHGEEKEIRRFLQERTRRRKWR